MADITYKRAPRWYRPLETYAKGVELRLKHWEDVRTARENGKLLIDGFVSGPIELFAGLGDFVSFGADTYAANVASEREFSIKSLEATEARGFARDTCGYFRNDVGSMFLDRYLFGGEYPRADFIFAAHDCEARGRWYRTKAEHMNVPIFTLEFPVGGKAGERDDHKIEYMASQLHDAVDWMEKVTGRKFDDERFIQALANSLRSQELWSEAVLLKSAIPTPWNVRVEASLISIPLLRRHEEVCVQWMKEFRDEIQYRVDNKIGCVQDEAKRLMTDQMPPWFALNITKYTEQMYGAVWVGMLSYTLSLGLWEVDDGGGLKVKRLSERPLKNRDDAVRVLAEMMALGKITYQRGPSEDKCDMALRFARTWKVDGAVLHYNRSCPGNCGTLREVQSALREAGILVVGYEAAGQDVREANEPEIRDILVRFMEMFGLKSREVQ